MYHVAIAINGVDSGVSHQPCDREDLLVDELINRGVKVTASCWSDPKVDWRAFDLVLPRSVWDYMIPENVENFQEWLKKLDKLKVNVMNATTTIRWNMDKHYLGVLKERGAPVPECVYVNRNSDVKDLLQLMSSHGWDDVFIRPCVASDSRWSLRVKSEQERCDGKGQKLVDEILNIHDKDVLLQRFVSDILSKGEWNLMFFDKVYSHGINRITVDDGSEGFLKGFRERLWKVPDKVIAAAQKVIDTVDGSVLYARVDLMEDGHDVHLVELELIEPSLFFGHDLKSAGRCADAVLAELKEIKNNKKE